MELEDLGPPTFAAHVVKYRGQLLELKTSNNQTGFHNINCAKDKRGRKNPYYAKFLPPGEKKQRMLPGSMSATAEGAATKLAWYVATQQDLRAVVPLTKPRKSAEVRCSHALRLISCVCLTHTHTLMSQEVHLMQLANEAEKLGILAMRLGSENIPVQPVHPVPPGMRFAHAVVAEPCGAPIDFGSKANDILVEVMLHRVQAHATDNVLE